MDFEHKLSLYSDALHEIKRRDHYIEKIDTERWRSLFDQVAIESCYLQFRMICEIIAFLPYVASFPDRIKRSDFSAEKLIVRIFEEFGDFYPRPIVQIMNPKPGLRAEWLPFDGDYLTKSKLEDLYRLCGNVLHAKHFRSSVID
jgi:hypothetical protein